MGRITFLKAAKTHCITGQIIFIYAYKIIYYLIDEKIIEN
jgi:hypothetical protein